MSLEDAPDNIFMRRSSAHKSIRARQEPVVAPSEPDQPDAAPTHLPVYEVELPSKGYFYNGVKHVSVSPMTVSQIRQLYGLRTVENQYNRWRGIVNVVGRCLHGFDVMRLTWPDFEFLMYWIRLNTYKQSPYIIVWNWTPPDWTTAKEVSTRVMFNDFEIIELPPHREFRYGYQRVEDRLSAMLLEDDSARWVAQMAACWPHGKDLEDKIARLDHQPAETLTDLQRHLNEARHGIIASIELSDPDYPEHGPFRHELKVDVDDFFPS